MDSKENLTPLKTLVFSMGFILMGGTVLLVGMVWKKTAAENHSPKAAECVSGHVDLKGRGTMVDSAVTGPVMRVTLQKSDGRSEIVSIDICSGRILGALTIDTDDAVIKQ